MRGRGAHCGVASPPFPPWAAPVARNPGGVTSALPKLWRYSLNTKSPFSWAGHNLVMVTRVVFENGQLQVFLAFLNFLLFLLWMWVALAIKKTVRGDETHLIKGPSTQRRGRWPGWALSVSWAWGPLHLPEEKQVAKGSLLQLVAT